MTHNEDDKANLYFILDSIREIQGYVGDKSYDRFTHDEQTVEEVIRLMNKIGSAARMLSDDFKQHYTSVNWETLINLEYMTFTQEYETNLASVWPIIVNDLPELEDNILRVSKNLEE